MGILPRTFDYMYWQICISYRHLIHLCFFLFTHYLHTHLEYSKRNDIEFWHFQPRNGACWKLDTLHPPWPTAWGLLQLLRNFGEAPGLASALVQQMPNDKKLLFLLVVLSWSLCWLQFRMSSVKTGRCCFCFLVAVMATLSGIKVNVWRLGILKAAVSSDQNCIQVT